MKFIIVFFIYFHLQSMMSAQSVSMEIDDIFSSTRISKLRVVLQSEEDEKKRGYTLIRSSSPSLFLKLKEISKEFVPTKISNEKFLPSDELILSEDIIYIAFYTDDEITNACTICDYRFIKFSSIKGWFIFYPVNIRSDSFQEKIRKLIHTEVMAKKMDSIVVDDLNDFLPAKINKQ